MKERICFRQVQTDSLMGLSMEDTGDDNDRPVWLECILPDHHLGWHLTSLKQTTRDGPLHVIWTREDIKCDCPKDTLDVCDCFDFSTVSSEDAQKMITAAGKGEA